MKKTVILFIVVLLVIVKYDLGFAKTNLQTAVENINHEKTITTLINEFNITESDYKSHKVIGISKEKFNTLKHSKSAIIQNNNLLENKLLNNKIDENELNNVIQLFSNNIKSISSARNFIDILKLKILENQLSKFTIQRANDLVEQYEKTYGKSKRWAVPVVIVAIGVTGALVGGSCHSTQSNQHANQPNIVNDNGSVTIVPYDNHGENINNGDGSVTMVPYNHDGTRP